MKKKNILISLAILLVLIGFFLVIIALKRPQEQPPAAFDADRAWNDLLVQMDFGPRTPGSLAHQQTREYIVSELKEAGWKVEIQESESMGHPIYNIIASRGSGSPWIVLGAHYDSRFVADEDANETAQTEPVPGANDGASGVAVLLELARVLPEKVDQQVWLVFFDAEDQGRIPGWDWILGSQVLAESLTAKPDAVVVIDMIGDKDLNIYREKSSDAQLTNSIWKTAKEMGYDQNFINEEKYSILDDHLPFLQLGIPAVDIIDFDYTYWHTSQDVAENVSAQSLEVVGNTLLVWMESFPGSQ